MVRCAYRDCTRRVVCFCCNQLAIFIAGKTKCIECNEIIFSERNTVAFPAFIPTGHKYSKYSDGIFHRECFDKWSDRTEFDLLYQQYLQVWDNRPDNLTSIIEIEEWGRKAFEELHTRWMAKKY